MADLRGKNICTSCGWVGSTADFLFRRRISSVCKLCRLKRQAQKINKKIEVEERKREKVFALRRLERDRLAEIERRKQIAAQND